MNCFAVICLPVILLVLPLGCAHRRTQHELEPLLPRPATTRAQQRADLEVMRNNPLFGDLYQGF